jgi:transposase-like protein
MNRRKKVLNKQQIISEYLTGNDTFLALSEKYGVKARTIQTWVRSYRKQHPVKSTQLNISTADEVKALKKQLEEEQLKNEVLSELLRLSEEQAGIDWRKKSGSRQ